MVSPAAEVEAPAAPVETSAARRRSLDLALVALLAAALRLPTLGQQSYSIDEAATIVVVRRSFGGMLHAVAHEESTPPLYYVLAWIWSHVLSTDEAAVRSLSALAGIALVCVVYLLGTALASRRIGLVAGVFAATSPYLVWYSQDARSYALFVLFSTAALYFCIRATQNSSTRYLVGWAALSVLALASHYFAVFPWLAQVGILLARGARKRAIVAAAATVAVAAVPLVLLARHQAGLGRVSWIGDLSLLQRLRVTAEVFALGASFNGSLPHRVLAVYALLAFVLGAGLAVAVVLLVRRADPGEQLAAATVGIVAGAVLAIPIVAAAAGHDYVLHRNVAPALPALVVGVACGVACRRAGLVGSAAAVAIAAAGTILTVVTFVATSTQRPDLRGVSERLGRPDRARALVFVPRWEQLVDVYQRGVEPLPTGGARVSEVDAFTAGSTIPPGVVPPAFRLVAVAHAAPFTIFRYRSGEPRAVTPHELEARLFPDSKRLPVAVLQRGP